MPFSPTFHLLSQEGYITRSCISTGLTEIRNANLDSKGRYYTGFFQLSIGIERMAKLALILDHMVSHQLTPPGPKAIRNYGHELITLYSVANTAAMRQAIAPTIEYPTSPFTNRILEFLSRFAKGARYANLDALASGSPSSEPLEEWSIILDEIIQTEVPLKVRERIKRESTILGEMLKDAAYVRAHDLKREDMTLEAYFGKPRLLNEAAKYAVWHAILLIAPLRDIVVALADAATNVNLQMTTAVAHVPYMRDFYQFLWADRRHVLQKKRWI